MALELTERELQIAAGNEPDESAIDTTVEDDGEVVEAVAGNDLADPASTEELESVKDEVAPDGGKDAAADPDQNAEPVEEAKSEELAPSAADWITDEVRQLGTSYKLSDEDLKGFKDEADFNRYAVLFDRQLSQKPETKAKADEVEPEAKADEADDDLDIDLEKVEAEFEDPLTRKVFKVAKKLQDENKAVTKQLAEVQQFVAARQAEAKINLFHDAVDTLDGKRYGKVVDEHGKVVPLEKGHDDNRRKLFDAAETIIAGIVARTPEGETPELPHIKILLKRAENLAFAEDIRAEERTKVRQEVVEQSKRRRPVGSRKTPVVAPKKSGEEPDYIGELLNNPELKTAFDKFQEENGTE